MSRKPKIAAGAVAASSAGAMGRASYTGKDIEAAMVDAIKTARAEGITDPAVIGKRMQAARKAVTRKA